MIYYLTIALQAFCVYHLIKNRIAYYWIFVIIFIPIVGSIIYLFTQVFNKKDVEKINSGVTSIINPTKKVKDLEQKLDFVETYQNRVDLADAYLELQDYDKAIYNYKIALKDDLQNNDFVLENLVKALYHSGQNDEVLAYVDRLKTTPNFNGSESQFIYGLALEQLGQLQEAEENLRAIDQRYSHYNQRLVLAKFLIRQNKRADANEILDEIFNESQHMNKNNKRKYRDTIKEVEALRAEK